MYLAPMAERWSFRAHGSPGLALKAVEVGAVGAAFIGRPLEAVGVLAGSDPHGRPGVDRVGVAVPLVAGGLPAHFVAVAARWQVYGLAGHPAEAVVVIVCEGRPRAVGMYMLVFAHTGSSFLGFAAAGPSYAGLRNWVCGRRVRGTRRSRRK